MNGDINHLVIFNNNAHNTVEYKQLGNGTVKSGRVEKRHDINMYCIRLCGAER